jgi:hypothetical protein
VLRSLEPEARALRWSILDLSEAFAPEGSDMNVLALEREVEASPTGLHLSFRELQRLADCLQQVVDGLFVGCANHASFPSRADSDMHIIERSSAVVAAFDSSFWLVSASGDVLDRLHRRFSQVSEMSVSAVRLSAWGR